MEEAGDAALELYRSHIVDTGYDAPQTFDDLLLFVKLSGAPISYHAEAPPGFSGIQVGNWIHVAGRGDLMDDDRKRILAHEWCHWLRRSRSHASMRLYSRGGQSRDFEEDVARAFETLFRHANCRSYSTIPFDIGVSDVVVSEILDDCAGMSDEDREQLRQGIEAFVAEHHTPVG
jgi:hypothetical protein